jgi:predicted DNA-binding WGR domain protein
MPDDLRSPIKHHLVLHRIDPEQGIRRFYSLMIEKDLFGTIRLVRNWGRIGTKGQELVEIHADEVAAGTRWPSTSLAITFNMNSHQTPQRTNGAANAPLETSCSVTSGGNGSSDRNRGSQTNTKSSDLGPQGGRASLGHTGPMQRLR